MSMFKRLIVALAVVFAHCGEVHSKEIRLYDLGHPLGAYRPAADGTPRRRGLVPVDDSQPYSKADTVPVGGRVSYTGRSSTNAASLGFFSGDLHLFDHTGTHLDAPRHFVVEGSSPERQLTVGGSTCRRSMDR